MATGVVPGVLTLPTAAALRVPAPPGLVVITTDDAAATAARLVRALDAGRVFTVAEAGAELGRRREAALAAPRDQLRRRREEAAAARARAATATASLPRSTARLDPRAVRRAAAGVADADGALETALAALGRRPRLDEAAARRAWESQSCVEAERVVLRAALRRCHAHLVWANAGAFAVVAGRVVSEAFDPAFFLVAGLPIAALASSAPAAAGSVRRTRAAARRRWEALRANDVSTLPGLAAREARARAWTERARRVEEAEAERGWAHEVWASLVGGAWPVRDAETLVTALEAAESARADAEAAERAWAEAAESLQAAEDDVDGGRPPLVVLDARPPARSRARRAALERLAAAAGNASVVLVAARAPAPATGAAPEVADRAVPAPRPAAGPAAAEVRDRVVAGLARLRSLAGKRRGPSPPALPPPPG